MVDAGTKLVASYPGGPITGIVESLIDHSTGHDFYVEWSNCEKVAFEVALGCSLAGKRSVMVAKHVEERPLPHLYRVRGTPRSLELDYRAWSNRGRFEELAIAGLLLDLEDGPDDYARGRDLPDLRIDWYDRYEDPALGTLIVGEVTNNTRSDYSEQTMVATEFLLDGRVVDTAWAITNPWDLQPFGTGFFAVVVPASLEWDEVRLAAFETAFSIPLMYSAIGSSGLVCSRIREIYPWIPIRRLLKS